MPDFPPWLYHYTSPEGLLGIVDQRVVRATVIHFLNDSKEFGHAIDESRVVLLQQMIVDQQDADARNIHERLAERLLQGAFGPNVCVFSLSAENDLLSQWRSYCPERGGYSLGFNAVELERVAGKHGFKLMRCIYDTYEQRSLLRPILQRGVDFALASSRSGLGIVDAVEKALGQIGFDFIRVAATLKNKAFSEEKEWRLVSNIVNFDDPNMKHRVGKTMIVPYFHLVLEPFPQFDVTVGPTTHSGIASKGVVSLLINAKLLGRGVRISQIPYRHF